MIEGAVDARGVPVLEMRFAGRTWIAMIDTGFNGFLKLPEDLLDSVNAKYIGPSESQLAGGYKITEDEYAVHFPFDGGLLRVRATFAPGDGILVGTRLLKPYRLTIDFPERRVWLERE